MSTLLLALVLGASASVHAADRVVMGIPSRVASLDPAKVWPNDPDCPLNAFRSQHRGEHLDDIEAAKRDGFPDRSH